MMFMLLFTWNFIYIQNLKKFLKIAYLVKLKSFQIKITPFLLFLCEQDILGHHCRSCVKLNYYRDLQLTFKLFKIRHNEKLQKVFKKFFSFAHTCVELVTTVFAFKKDFVSILK